MIETTYVDHMGSDLSVVNAARVSFGKKSKLVCTNLVLGTYDMSNGDKRLIKYLAKHKHISPFGHAFASFHIKAPIFVARQLVKHKFLRWNEISRRYVDDEPEFYVPDVWRGRSADKKQGSSDKEMDLNSLPDLISIQEGDYDRFSPLGVDEDCDISYQEGLTDDIIVIKNRYKDLISLGVAPEQARMVLPQSTMTEWYWSGSLDAFADMCRLRCKDDTQAETRIVADQISNHMAKLFPVSWGALTENDDD